MKNGLCYDINSDGASVTVVYESFSYTEPCYTSLVGDVVVPESVEYDGKTYPVLKIGDFAFRNCADITGLSVPKSVVSVGKTPFSGCSGLKSVKWNAKNCSDFASALFASSAITSLIIGNEVEHIPANLCSGCGITDLTIPNSVTEIGTLAFSNCESLKSVAIPGSVTSVGGGIFKNCTGLTSVTWNAENCSDIASAPFQGATGITSFVLGNGVKRVPANLCSGCSSLTGVIIPNSVTEIGAGAFKNCTGLKNVTLPTAITKINGGTFNNCSSLSSIAIPNAVTSIGSGAFMGCTSMRIIEIPVDLEIIGYGAFVGCTALTEVKWNARNSADFTMPPFENLENLSKFTFGNEVSRIPKNLCAYCAELKNVTIPESTTVIDDYAFIYCTGLKSVSIPNTVRTIGDGAFLGCRSLSSIDLPDDLTAIGTASFYDCAKLTSVEIPGSVTSIGSSAFMDCTQLRAISIPNSVATIGESAFESTALQEVTIPASVGEIKANAFMGCNALSSIIVDGENPKYDSRDNCNAIIETESNRLVLGCKTTLIPGSVASIGVSAFSGCKALERIAIPNSVTSIGSAAFNGCMALKSVSIPGSVTEIGNYAFENCRDLQHITNLAQTPQDIVQNVFDNVNQPACKLIVPDESYEDYSAASVWKNFTIMKISEDVGVEDITGDVEKEVRGVRYYNMLGVESAEPFSGVNVKVTTFSDGTRSAEKVLR